MAEIFENQEEKCISILEICLLDYISQIVNQRMEDLRISSPRVNIKFKNLPKICLNPYKDASILGVAFSYQQ